MTAGEQAAVVRDGRGPELRRGEFHADADQADPEPVDPRFGTGPLPGAQREAAEVTEGAAERPVLSCQLQRRPDLAEYLVLAHDHRVQPARHGQQVLHRAVLVVHVQAAGQLARRDARVPGQQLAYPVDTAVEPPHLGVDLDPVAGRDHEGLRDVRQVRDVAQQLAERVSADRGALEGRHRRALVVQPDDEDAHRCTAYASTAAGSATCPNRSADRRWAWKASICSSIDRSTLRTSTPAGTFSTTGAKFKMLVTPAATSRSHMAWATPAGTAITPIAILLLATTASSSLAWRTITEPSLRPTRDRSLSSTADIRKPRETKPP